MTDFGWLGVILMSVATIWSGNFAIVLSSVREMMFREAKPASTKRIFGKTLLQILVVWTLILVVIPYFIVILEAKLGIPRLVFTGQSIIAALLLVLISWLGIASAYTMSDIGKGTPLPLAAATKLVVSGTYAFVRNPMAISGIGQGIAVALLLGSPLVFLYALTGAFIWQIIFRPLEEEYLKKNFGAECEEYRRNVRCWIPKLKPYQTD